MFTEGEDSLMENGPWLLILIEKNGFKVHFPFDR